MMDPREAWPHRLLTPPIALGLTASALIAMTLLLPGQPHVHPSHGQSCPWAWHCPSGR